MTTSSGFLSITPTSLPYLSIYSTNTGISLTQSANNTITSYFQVSWTMRVWVNGWYNSFIATQQIPQFSFWNLTDSLSEIWSTITTATSSSDMSQQIVGTCVLTAGKSYTIIIGSTVYDIKSFGLVLEEITEIASNTFTYSNSDTAPLTVINTNTGNSALGVWSAANSWRMWTDASGNLIFEKESAPGSNVWVTKGSVSG